MIEVMLRDGRGWSQAESMPVLPRIGEQLRVYDGPLGKGPALMTVKDVVHDLELSVSEVWLR